ncbi:hypothetical protein Pst134EB_016152 [Puccinia striiformis f. sp. tritici]|nr:hypothetical protein Pst134EB_016152 [Puccinia striiformis f. sp. tritici]
MIYAALTQGPTGAFDCPEKDVQFCVQGIVKSPRAIKAVLTPRLRCPERDSHPLTISSIVRAREAVASLELIAAGAREDCDVCVSASCPTCWLPPFHGAERQRQTNDCRVLARSNTVLNFTS